MCGIAGWYRRGPEVLAAHLDASCATIRHRGPDDQGLLTDGDFGFGMRRLSIIDIAGGHQPIESEDGTLAIIFNGEIYNHLELRPELERAGARFATRSDTETVLAAWRHWGEGAWPRLEGMFAVAIWDRRARQLILARDHLGIKPLYVTEQHGGLAFASELKALRALPGLEFDIDPRAVHDYFSFGHTVSPRSIYRQVGTLPPGHALTLGPTGAPRIVPFWRPRFAVLEGVTEHEWVEQFRARWLDTVASHMLSDVPVGAFLSGGIDSSAIVAAMTRVSDRPVQTFTIGFPSARFNEAPFAEQVAAHLGCNHVTRTVDLKAAADILPDIQRCYDEPFADPAAVPTWYVAELAARHVKVVLSGDGGDEVFAGYRRHRTEDRMSRLPAVARLLARGVMGVPRTPFRSCNAVLQKWQKAVSDAAAPDGCARFFARTQITSPELRRRVYAPGFHAQVEGPRPYEALRDEYFPSPARISANTLEQFLFADLTLNLPDGMLTKVDRATMAHSLEARVPFLSHTLVDWALTMPVNLKMRGGVGKYIVRKSVEPWLPKRILERGKQGFQMPLAEWFAGDFGVFARELWHDSGVARTGVLDPRAVDAVFIEHRTGRSDHSRLLYAIAMYALWWSAQKD